MHKPIVYIKVGIHCRPLFNDGKVPDEIYRVLQHGEIYIFYNHLLPQYFDSLADLLEACEETHNFDEHKRIVLDMSIECVPAINKGSIVYPTITHDDTSYCFLPTKFMASCSRHERRIASLMKIITVRYLFISPLQKEILVSMVMIDEIERSLLGSEI